MYPQIEINLRLIEQNMQMILSQCRKRGIEPVAVTKVHKANRRIVDLLIKTGFKKFGDSRLQNLKRLKEYDVEKLLIRIPMPSEIEELVEIATSSLISSVSIAQLIDKEAKKQNKIFKVTLMYDIGDLREGIYGQDNLFQAVKEIESLENVILHGIGTNMGCMNGILPSEDNLTELVHIKEKTEQCIGRKIEVLSAGNTDVFAYLLEHENIKGINELRIGEAIMMGTDAAEGNIDILKQNAAGLHAEVIEVYEKPSSPTGNIGLNPFGEKVESKDLGIRRRAILALGRQDVSYLHIIPKDENIMIIGQSSDHTVLDLTSCTRQYQLGDIVEFNLKYGGILAAYTSEFIEKNYKE
jgi:predicted amino acid racemase